MHCEDTEFWIKRLKRLGDIREEEEKLKSEDPGTKAVKA